MSSKILILISFSIISEVGYSLLAPLYPFIAKKLGLSNSLIGLVFSSFALSNFFATLITPTLIILIGRQRCFYLGILTEGICTICFGLISFILIPPEVTIPSSIGLKPDIFIVKHFSN